MHHHSHLCLHNLLHYNLTIQITYTPTHNPKTHHNHPLLHNLGNSLLLGQILIHPPIQPFIPAAETHIYMSSSPLQHIPKSVNGERVKSSKQENRSSAPDGQLCFCCKQPGHLKKDCPEQPYCSKCRTRGHIPAKCPSKQ